MDTYESYEKKDLPHSYICRLFLNGALLFWIVKMVILTVSIVQLCLRPESAIELIDTGYSYRFDAFVGYMQCRYELLPIGIEMVSKKAFCIAFILLSGMTKDLPILIILGYLRRIMSVIKNSHSPFVLKTVHYTGKIGNIMILMGIFGEIVFRTGMSLLACHVLCTVGQMEFSWIFAGIIVLFAKDILKWGCELQEFSDETL